MASCVPWAAAHTIGSGSFTLADLVDGVLVSGAGPRLASAIAALGFPAIGSTSPFRFTVMPLSAGGVAVPGVTPVSRYLATSLVGDVLSGLTVATGSTDLVWAPGDMLACYWDGGAVLELRDAIGSGGLVTSVAGRTGAVTLAVADVSGAAPLASPASDRHPDRARRQPVARARAGRHHGICRGGHPCGPLPDHRRHAPRRDGGRPAVCSDRADARPAHGRGGAVDQRRGAGLHGHGCGIVAAGGVSGGQTICGDTASGGNLTLVSTSHATKVHCISDRHMLPSIARAISTPLRSVAGVGRPRMVTCHRHYQSEDYYYISVMYAVSIS